MSKKKLNDTFEEAVEKINNYTRPIPADMLLRLYAYYKIATRDNSSPRSNKHYLIDAFKTNALFQARNLTETQAKKYYITLVEKILLG